RFRIRQRLSSCGRIEILSFRAEQGISPRFNPVKRTRDSSIRSELQKKWGLPPQPVKPCPKRDPLLSCRLSRPVHSTDSTKTDFSAGSRNSIAYGANLCSLALTVA